MTKIVSMKIFIPLSLSLIFITGTLSAQNVGNENALSGVSILNMQPEPSMFDKIQQETESISAIKPLLYVGSIIESRLALKKAGRQAIAASVLKYGNQ